MASFNNFQHHIGEYTNSSSNPLNRALAQHCAAYQAGDNRIINPCQQDKTLANSSRNPSQNIFQSTHQDHFQNGFQNDLQDAFENAFQKQDEMSSPSKDIVMTDAPLVNSLEFDTEKFLSGISEPLDITNLWKMCRESDKPLTYPIEMDIDWKNEDDFNFQLPISNYHSMSISAYEARDKRLRDRRSRGIQRANRKQSRGFASQSEIPNSNTIGFHTQEFKNLNESFGVFNRH
ncbi:hypothetical protein F4776DRAFT_191731 [Hypoxylon sp. NC0597]|nr:hypothetical protein F4776DRAFT_191731 [Hypoxylon sp. NC0597]